MTPCTSIPRKMFIAYFNRGLVTLKRRVLVYIINIDINILFCYRMGCDSSMIIIQFLSVTN